MTSIIDQGKTIARIFPTKTSMSPIDKDCYFSDPDMFTSHYDEAHISVVFTWDKEKAEKLAHSWKYNANKVIIGGPAYNDNGDEFVSSKYIKKGITITSRGCCFNCDFCFVPKREGKIRELPIVEGNIIQDNNILACSKEHIDKVFQMLKKQRQIRFMGLDTRLLNDWHIEALRGLKINELWFACDRDTSIKNIDRISDKLQVAGFNRNKLHCYVLIGDNMEENRNRLRRVYELGFMPFAQLYKNENNNNIYSKEWKQFARKYSRPAITRKICEGGKK